MKKFLKSLFISAAFSFVGFAYAGSPIRQVQISTGALTVQTGAFNVTGSSMVTVYVSSSANFNASTVTANGGVFNGAWYEGSTITFRNAGILGTRSDKSTTTLVGAVFNGTKIDNSTGSFTGTLDFTGATVNLPTEASVKTSSIQANGNPLLIYDSNGFVASTVATSGMSIQGTNTNDLAGNGKYGEFISSATLARTIGTSTQYFDLVQITLTAGDWDVGFNTYVAANGATVVYCETGIATSSGNSATGAVAGDNYNAFLAPTATAQNGIGLAPWRASISSTTTYYLKLVCQYSVATPRANGRISARRVR